MKKDKYFIIIALCVISLASNLTERLHSFSLKDFRHLDSAILDLDNTHCKSEFLFFSIPSVLAQQLTFGTSDNEIACRDLAGVAQDGGFCFRGACSTTSVYEQTCEGNGECLNVNNVYSCHNCMTAGDPYFTMGGSPRDMGLTPTCTWSGYDESVKGHPFFVAAGYKGDSNLTSPNELGLSVEFGPRSAAASKHERAMWTSMPEAISTVRDSGSEYTYINGRVWAPSSLAKVGFRFRVGFAVTQSLRIVETLPSSLQQFSVAEADRRAALLSATTSTNVSFSSYIPKHLALRQFSDYGIFVRNKRSAALEGYARVPSAATIFGAGDSLTFSDAPTSADAAIVFARTQNLQTVVLHQSLSSSALVGGFTLNLNRFQSYVRTGTTPFERYQLDPTGYAGQDTLRLGDSISDYQHRLLRLGVGNYFNFSNAGSLTRTLRVSARRAVRQRYNTLPNATGRMNRNGQFVADGSSTASAGLVTPLSSFLDPADSIRIPMELGLPLGVQRASEWEELVSKGMAAPTFTQSISNFMLSTLPFFQDALVDGTTNRLPSPSEIPSAYPTDNSGNPVLQNSPTSLLLDRKRFPEVAMAAQFSSANYVGGSKRLPMVTIATKGHQVYASGSNRRGLFGTFDYLSPYKMDEEARSSKPALTPVSFFATESERADSIEQVLRQINTYLAELVIAFPSLDMQPYTEVELDAIRATFFDNFVPVRIIYIQQSLKVIFYDNGFSYSIHKWASPRRQLADPFVYPWPAPYAPSYGGACLSHQCQNEPAVSNYTDYLRQSMKVLFDDCLKQTRKFPVLKTGRQLILKNDLHFNTAAASGISPDGDLGMVSALWCRGHPTKGSLVRLFGVNRYEQFAQNGTAVNVSLDYTNFDGVLSAANYTYFDGLTDLPLLGLPANDSDIEDIAFGGSHMVVLTRKLRKAYVAGSLYMHRDNIMDLTGAYSPLSLPPHQDCQAMKALRPDPAILYSTAAPTTTGNVTSTTTSTTRTTTTVTNATTAAPTTSMPPNTTAAPFIPKIMSKTSSFVLVPITDPLGQEYSVRQNITNETFVNVTIKPFWERRIISIAAGDNYTALLVERANPDQYIGTGVFASTIMCGGGNFLNNRAEATPVNYTASLLDSSSFKLMQMTSLWGSGMFMCALKPSGTETIFRPAPAIDVVPSSLITVTDLVCTGAANTLINAQSKGQLYGSPNPNANSLFGGFSAGFSRGASFGSNTEFFKNTLNTDVSIGENHVNARLLERDNYDSTGNFFTRSSSAFASSPNIIVGGGNDLGQLGCAAENHVNVPTNWRQAVATVPESVFSTRSPSQYTFTSGQSDADNPQPFRHYQLSRVVRSEAYENITYVVTVPPQYNSPSTYARNISVILARRPSDGIYSLQMIANDLLPFSDSWGGGVVGMGYFSSRSSKPTSVGGNSIIYDDSEDQSYFTDAAAHMDNTIVSRGAEATSRGLANVTIVGAHSAMPLSVSGDVMWCRSSFNDSALYSKLLNAMPVGFVGVSGARDTTASSMRNNAPIITNSIVPPSIVPSLMSDTYQAGRSLPFDLSQPESVRVYKNTIARRSALGPYQWGVSFSLIPGMVLFHVSNQTSTTGSFSTPVGAVSCLAEDLSLPEDDDELLDLLNAQSNAPFVGRRDFTSPSNRDATFFRDWSLLRRSRIAPNGEFSLSDAWSSFSATATTIGAGVNISVTVIKVEVAEVFFVTDDGRTFPLRQLSRACGSSDRNLYVCDEKEKLILWAHASAGPTVPAGYRRGLSSNFSSISMFVSLSIRNETYRKLTDVSYVIPATKGVYRKQGSSAVNPQSRFARKNSPFWTFLKKSVVPNIPINAPGADNRTVYVLQDANAIAKTVFGNQSSLEIPFDALAGSNSDVWRYRNTDGSLTTGLSTLNTSNPFLNYGAACETYLSFYDCSSISFFEPFHPNKTSLSQMLSFTQGGIQVIQNQSELQRSQSPARINPAASTPKSYTRYLGEMILQSRSLYATSDDLLSTYITNVCIFLKVGRFFYFVRLQREIVELDINNPQTTPYPPATKYTYVMCDQATRRSITKTISPREAHFTTQIPTTTTTSTTTTSTTTSTTTTSTTTSTTTMTTTAEDNATMTIDGNATTIGGTTSTSPSTSTMASTSATTATPAPTPSPTPRPNVIIPRPSLTPLRRWGIIADNWLNVQGLDKYNNLVVYNVTLPTTLPTTTTLAPTTLPPSTTSRTTTTPTTTTQRSTTTRITTTSTPTTPTTTTAIPPTFLATIDPLNLTFELSCQGGVSIDAAGRKDFSNYVLLTNSSLMHSIFNTIYDNLDDEHDTDLERRLHSWSHNSSLFVHSTPMGCDGSRYIAIQPPVPALDTLEFFYHADAAFGENEAFVFKLHTNYHRRNGWVPQFVIDKNGFTVEEENEDLKSKTLYGSHTRQLCQITLHRGADLEQAFARRDKMATGQQNFCRRRSWGGPIDSYVRVLLSFDRYTGVTRVYRNHELMIIGSRILSYGRDLVNPTHLQMRMRNPSDRIVNNYRIREVGMCLNPRNDLRYVSGEGSSASSTEGIKVPAYNVLSSTQRSPGGIFPCHINGNEIGLVIPTASLTISAELTMTVSVLKTTTSTLTRTAHISRTLTLTNTINPPPTPTLTYTKQLTATKSTLITSTRTITISKQPSESKTITSTAGMDVYLAGASYDRTLLTTHNIRRSGVPITLLLGGDVFSVRGVDWGNAAALGMVAFSTSGTGHNPTGFQASFYKEGFINNGVRGFNGNNSYLSFVIGSALFYNSYRDETVRIIVMPKGAASTFVVKGHIDLKIEGRGFMLTNTLEWLELSAGIFAFSNIVIGGQMSTALRLSSNTVLVQFRCFNEEDVPLSYLQNPFRFFISGDEQITVMVISCCVFAFVGCVHLLITKYVQHTQQKSWPTAKGITYYPSFTIALVIMFVPNFVANAWQTALRNQETEVLVGAALLTIIFVVAPFVFILNEIYDDANCAAEYEPFDKDMIANYRSRRPLLYLFMPTGKWNSLDRHLTFAKQHYFVLWEYSSRARYWFCVELVEAIIGAIVSSISNGERYICIGQTAVLALCKILLFAGLFYYRPYNALFWQAATMIITLAQATILCIKFVDVIKGETRAMQAVMRSLFFAVLAAILLVAVVGFLLRLSRAIYIKRMERKTVHRLARLAVPLADAKAPVEPLRDAIVVDHFHDMYILPTEEELKEREALRALKSQFEAMQRGENHNFDVAKSAKATREMENYSDESDNEIEMQDVDNNTTLTPSGLRINTDTFRLRAGSSVFSSPDGSPLSEDGRASVHSGTGGGPPSILKPNNNTSFADYGGGPLLREGTASVTFSDRILPSGHRQAKQVSDRPGRADSPVQTSEPKTSPQRDKGLVPRSRNLWHLLAMEEAAAQTREKSQVRDSKSSRREDPFSKDNEANEMFNYNYDPFGNSAFGTEHESVGSSDKGSQRSGRGTSSTRRQQEAGSAVANETPWWSKLSQDDRVPEQDLRFRGAPPPRQPWLVPSAVAQNNAPRARKEEVEEDKEAAATRVKYDPYYDDPAGFL